MMTKILIFSGVGAVGGVLGAAAASLVTPLLKTSWKHNLIMGIAFGTAFTASAMGGAAFKDVGDNDGISLIVGSIAIAAIASVFAAVRFNPETSLKQRTISTTVIGLSTVGLIASFSFAFLTYMVAPMVEGLVRIHGTAKASSGLE